MNIPAVISLGEDLKKEYDGKLAIVDGLEGKVYIEPDAKTMEAMQEKQRKDQEQKELLEQLKGKENITKSGQKVNLYANIGNLADVGAVLKMTLAASGCSEASSFIWKARRNPTEEHQFSVYKTSGGEYGRQKGHYPHPGYRR